MCDFRIMELNGKFYPQYVNTYSYNDTVTVFFIFPKRVRVKKTIWKFFKNPAGLKNKFGFPVEVVFLNLSSAKSFIENIKISQQPIYHY